MKTAIIGGGAAGFFLAINLKEMCPAMDVTIFEKNSKLLRKVAISGGGRCNCTNTFNGVTDLKHVYPRGHRLMKRLFKTFNNVDAVKWFESHGVELMSQSDNCVFPKAQDSQVIINCFLKQCFEKKIKIKASFCIDSFQQVADYDYIAITTGGTTNLSYYEYLIREGHSVERPIPSLFSLSLKNNELKQLMGIVVNNASLQIVGTKIQSRGDLLITHWGISGPATLKLSSYAARWFYENNYNAILKINWISDSYQSATDKIINAIASNGNKLVVNYPPFKIQHRLWIYITQKALKTNSSKRWNELSKNDINKLVNTLVNDQLEMSGRAPHRDEFVTCGGISLNSINSNSLQSKYQENLYFAGEVLDIDGITGGFNFQAAWTTAFVVAEAISQSAINN